MAMAVPDNNQILFPQHGMVAKLFPKKDTTLQARSQSAARKLAVMLAMDKKLAGYSLAAMVEADKSPPRAGSLSRYFSRRSLPLPLSVQITVLHRQSFECYSTRSQSRDFLSGYRQKS